MLIFPPLFIYSILILLRTWLEKGGLEAGAIQFDTENRIPICLLRIRTYLAGA